MTDFKQEVRHYCRNPKCRSKLKSPVSNPREAFCAGGCYRSFHLKRCGVCEKSLEQRYRKLKRGALTKFAKMESRGQTCGSPECKRRWRDGDGLGQFWPGRYQGSQSAGLHKEVPANGPVFEPIQKPKNAKRWVQIAGDAVGSASPPLTPNQFHCATVPDGPDCKREGGEFERVEAKNCAALKAANNNALIQRQHMPVNIQGGYHPMYRSLKIGPEKTLEEIRNKVAPFDEPDAKQWTLPDPGIPGLAMTGCRCRSIRCITSRSYRMT